MKNNEITNAIIQERFGKDSLIALATVDGDIPAVRTVNTVYIDGAFYVVTYALSGKMKQIAKNPTVAICGDWFTAHGVGENLGHVLGWPSFDKTAAFVHIPVCVHEIVKLFQCKCPVCENHLSAYHFVSPPTYP